jgi:hypothetical protein
MSQAQNGARKKKQLHDNLENCDKEDWFLWLFAKQGNKYHTCQGKYWVTKIVQGQIQAQKKNKHSGKTETSK